MVGDQVFLRGPVPGFIACHYSWPSHLPLPADCPVPGGDDLLGYGFSANTDL